MSLEWMQTDGEAVEQINFKVLLPYPKYYKLRCVGAEFGKSKSRVENDIELGNNPMITLKFEIIEPEKVMIKDPANLTEKIEAKVLGLTVSDRIVLTAKAASFVKAACKRFGVEPETLDSETPNYQQFVGKEGWAMIKSEAKWAIDEDKNHVINPVTGERVVRYQHQIAEWA